jgi:hypothetical protein
MTGSIQAAETTSSPLRTCGGGDTPCAEVLRTTRALGLGVVARLRWARVRLGPVVDTAARHAVEFVVPPGTARSWLALPGTTCVSACCTRWPGSVGGRRWLVAPSVSAEPYTDADALCEAVAAELLRRAVGGTGRRRGCP